MIGYFFMFATIPLFVGFGMLIEESKVWATGYKTKYIIGSTSLISGIIILFGLGVMNL